jgi:N-glycosylase/DNA lyase
VRKLLNKVNALKKSGIKDIIDGRIKEFKSLGRKPVDELFKEVCFCILTANFNAERGIKIQKALGKDFLEAKEEELALRLKEQGHRFPNTRAKYIVEARKHKDMLREAIKKAGSEHGLRDYLAKKIKGLGYKEASHFMRNIGFDNCAIIDFHIVDILEEHALIKKVKNLSNITYLHIESVLKTLADKLGLTLAELDLYLWYLETGKILK